MFDPEDFFLLSTLAWLPKAVFVVLWFAAAVYFWREKKNTSSIEGSIFELVNKLPHITLRGLIWTGLAATFFFAAAKTAAQYYIWSYGSFSRLLLEMPLGGWKNDSWIFSLFPAFASSGGYFSFYAFTRFWFGAILGIAFAVLLYYALTRLKEFRGRMFEGAEPELGFLIAILVGWPNVILFFCAFLLLTVFLSLYRVIIVKQRFTTLGASILWAGFMIILFGDWIGRILGFGVLKI